MNAVSVLFITESRQYNAQNDAELAFLVVLACGIMTFFWDVLAKWSWKLLISYSCKFIYSNINLLIDGGLSVIPV